MPGALTRRDRRRMRRHADKLAAALAATTLCEDAAKGELCRVSDPAARAVLARGWAAMIRNSCRPVVHRLTEEEARALPGYRETRPGATWWCGFGLDIDQRATWVARWAYAEGMDGAAAADAAEVVVLRDLAGACNQSGILGEVAP